MRFFGRRTHEADEYIELKDFDVEADPEALRKLADFLVHAANEMEQLEPREIENRWHTHADLFLPDWREFADGLDFTVYSPRPRKD